MNHSSKIVYAFIQSLSISMTSSSSTPKSISGDGDLSLGFALRRGGTGTLAPPAPVALGADGADLDPSACPPEPHCFSGCGFAGCSFALPLDEEPRPVRILPEPEKASGCCKTEHFSQDTQILTENHTYLWGDFTIRLRRLIRRQRVTEEKVAKW